MNVTIFWPILDSPLPLPLLRDMTFLFSKLQAFSGLKIGNKNKEDSPLGKPLQGYSLIFFSFFLYLNLIF